MGDFEGTTIKSFRVVKADVDEFRRSMDEWIIFLDGSLRDLKIEVMALKRKIDKVESELDMM